MLDYDPVLLTKPASGEAIVSEGGVLRVPDHPIVPYIEGDGIGADVTPAMRRVVDCAVKKVYVAPRG